MRGARRKLGVFLCVSQSQSKRFFLISEPSRSLMAGSNGSFDDRDGCAELLLVLAADCMFRWCGNVGIMFGSQAASDPPTPGENCGFRWNVWGFFVGGGHSDCPIKVAATKMATIEIAAIAKKAINLRVGNSLKYILSRHSAAVARLLGSYMNRKFSRRWPAFEMSANFVLMLLYGCGRSVKFFTAGNASYSGHMLDDGVPVRSKTTKF